MLRRTLAVAAAIGLVLVLADLQPASAVGITDPNDVAGRLDIRSADHEYLGPKLAEITVRLYPNFRRRALPTKRCQCGRSLWVELDEFTSGRFVRAGGHIKFIYGDYGSACCSASLVHRATRVTLVARYVPFDEGDPGFRAFAHSTWVLNGNDVVDKTRRFKIGPPPS